MCNLSLTNICKSYGDQQVLCDFSYSFPETGLFHLQGESGKGKTTLLRIIAGLEEPTSGVVTAPSVSYLFQDRRLFPTLTALENVTLVNAKKGADMEGVIESAKTLLATLGLTSQDMEKYPHELSGGMLQRVAIARALLFPSPVLLLDEPAKELDPQNRDVLNALITEEAKKRLVILVSHDASSEEGLDATRILLL